MSTTSPGAVTELLQRASGGDDDAFERIFGLVYQQLHKLAKRQLRLYRVGETLNTTALVHEAYLKLIRSEDHAWAAHRETFFAVSSRAMRQIVIDQALHKVSLKRGGPDAVEVELDDQIAASEVADAERLLAVEAALGKLGEIDERLVQVVECRFYAGLTEEETAEALGISHSSVQRAWRRARVWLREFFEAE